MLGGMSQTVSEATQGKAVECPQGPSDTPTEVQWLWPSPNTHPFVFASSWDGTVRAWEVQTEQPLFNRKIEEIPSRVDPLPKILNVVPKAMWNNNSPTLCVCPSSAAVFSGTADKRVLAHDLASQQTQQIGQVNAPVCNVFHNTKSNIIVSLSWDRNIKAWDPRQQKSVLDITAPANVMAGDMSEKVLAVLTDDRKVYAYNLDPFSGTPATWVPLEPLIHTARKIRLFPDSSGVVIAGYEGRCRIANFNQTQRTADFTFRCHRLFSHNWQPVTANPNTGGNQQSILIYSVNCVDFNPIYNTLLTSGADGGATTWDKDVRQRIQMIPNLSGPVTCGRFDTSGRLFGYGTGYDWSEGINGKSTITFRKTTAVQNRVCVMMMTDESIHSKPPKK